MPRGAALRVVDGLLERVALTPYSRRPTRELSTGMRRRLSFARALIGEPEILLLDEPTRGVDPTGAHSLHELLRSQLRDGRTIVIATHDRQEAEALCSRVAVLHRSKLLALDTPERGTSLLMGLSIG
jgi:ABC-2 type transport system ATP-binding protein